MKKYDESDAYYDVQAELLAGEELLWVGTPDPMRFLIRFALKQISSVTSGIFILIAWLYIIDMGFAKAMFFTIGFGGVPLIIGILMLIVLGTSLWQISAPLRQYFMATCTLYGISDRRVLIISGFPSRSTQSFRADQMQFVDTRVHPNGTGDIIFQREQQMRPQRSNTIYIGNQTHTVETGFFGVHNPREVEAIMLETFMRRND
jgi:hypothetical protein